MQLVGTREAGHQGGRVGAPGLAEPRRPGSDRPMDQAVPGQAPGVDGAGCGVEPGRGTSLSTSPFPGPHPRTRRARLHAPDSPRAPSWMVALAFGSAVPSPCSHTIGTPVFTGDSRPANPPRLARCAPSPCDRLSRPPTTTGTPPRPATSRRMTRPQAPRRRRRASDKRIVARRQARPAGHQHHRLLAPHGPELDTWSAVSIIGIRIRGRPRSDHVAP
jgi:hypothetical protein